MVVYNGPNEYGVENNGTDFVMQTSPEKISAS
jgi:hypothetical protein